MMWTMPIRFEFSVRRATEVSWLSLGDIRLAGPDGAATSAGRHPDQACMIFASLVELLSGLHGFLTSPGQRAFVFAAVGSSYSIAFERCGQSVVVSSMGRSVGDISGPDLRDAVLDAADDFLAPWWPSFDGAPIDADLRAALAELRAPGYLREMLAESSLDRPVAVWHLLVPSWPGHEVADVLARGFFDSFEWTRVATGVKRKGWRVLDLRLAWSESDEGWLQACARVRLRPMEGCELVVCLNAFTDHLSVAPTRIVGFLAAARRNRARLRESLAAWETATAGRVIAWRSTDLTGVDRTGFLDSAAPGGSDRGSTPFSPLPTYLKELHDWLLAEGFRSGSDTEGPMGYRDLRLVRGQLTVGIYGERAHWWLTVDRHDAYAWRCLLDGDPPSRDRIDEVAFVRGRLDDIARLAGEPGTQAELARIEATRT